MDFVDGEIAYPQLPARLMGKNVERKKLFPVTIRPRASGSKRLSAVYRLPVHVLALCMWRRQTPDLTHRRMHTMPCATKKQKGLAALYHVDSSQKEPLPGKSKAKKIHHLTSLVEIPLLIVVRIKQASCTSPGRTDRPSPKLKSAEPSRRPYHWTILPPIEVGGRLAVHIANN